MVVLADLVSNVRCHIEGIQIFWWKTVTWIITLVNTLLIVLTILCRKMCTPHSHGESLRWTREDCQHSKQDTMSLVTPVTAIMVTRN